jgi:hypothetical protein
VEVKKDFNDAFKKSDHHKAKEDDKSLLYTKDNKPEVINLSKL